MFSLLSPKKENASANEEVSELQMISLYFTKLKKYSLRLLIDSPVPAKGCHKLHFYEVFPDSDSFLNQTSLLFN